MGGNRVDLLEDGPPTFEAMFAAIDAAKDHINIEGYVVEADGPGEELSQRLVARCHAGVQVNLLFDGFGPLGMSHAFFQRLRAAGVTLCEFNPLPRWRLWLAPGPHLRDHRKTMVVDGRIGFIGGRDLHVRVEGPVVQRLQRQFISHWQRHSTTSLPLARYHPPLPPVGTQRAALAASDAGRHRNPYHGALLAAIDSAHERVWLTTACMVPPRRLIRALVQAAGRGVQVHLLLPGHTDSWAPLHAGRSHYARLLQAGVRIHERHDRLLHSKACVIDGIWCSVGSSNADWRSVIHDAEANLVVLDEGFAGQLERVFRDDLACARPIDAASWSLRPLWHRAKESVARRFEFLL
jgi:cardiolipin synthase